MDSERRTAIHEAMVRLADGDRSAMDVLLDKLWPVLLAFCRRGVPQTADAEDVAQEVFYKLCARINEFDQARDGLSWAFGIAGYEVMTFRRRQQRRREVSDNASLLEAIDGAASQEEQLLAQEMRLAFEESLGALTPEDRLYLGLEKASSGARGTTLRKRKQRALQRLRVVWRQIYGAP